MSHWEGGREAGSILVYGLGVGGEVQIPLVVFGVVR